MFKRENFHSETFGICRASCWYGSSIQRTHRGRSRPSHFGSQGRGDIWIVANYCARPDAKVVGVIGAGQQARAPAEAMCAVRPTNRSIEVNSTTRESCEAFAKEMSGKLGVEVLPVENARDCCRGVDIVINSTNSVDPVLFGDWLEDGTHVITMRGSPRFQGARECDDDAMRRSSTIVVDSKEQVTIDQQQEILSPLKRGYIIWEDICEVAYLCTNPHPGRTAASQITYHNTNVGMASSSPWFASA